MHSKGRVKRMQMSGIFYFDPGDKIYETHFPGSPVVPGSLIVHAFIQACSRIHGESVFQTHELSVKNFKFKEFVLPGEYRYTLLKENNNQVRCSLYNGQTRDARRVAQGVITI